MEETPLLGDLSCHNRQTHDSSNKNTMSLGLYTTLKKLSYCTPNIFRVLFIKAWSSVFIGYHKYGAICGSISLRIPTVFCGSLIFLLHLAGFQKSPVMSKVECKAKFLLKIFIIPDQSHFVKVFQNFTHDLNDITEFDVSSKGY